MRVFPVVIALIVCTVLYFVVLDREALVDFAARFGGTEDTVAATTAGAAPVTQAPETRGDARVVHVVARRSEADLAQDSILLRGRTQAFREVTVKAETSGLIVSAPIRAGAFVVAGALLCEIDPGTRAAALSEAEARLDEARARLPEARARVAEAEARLTAARIDNNAASRLSESGFASETRAATTVAVVSAGQAAMQSAQAGVEAAQSGIRSAEAGLERALEDLTRLQINAPFAGHLETDTAELGAFMQPGTPCATILQLDPIKLVGFVPEAQVDRVEMGAAAGARLATGSEVQGEVMFISRSSDPQTRTFRVEVDVPNPDLTIRDGQSADILISAAGTPAHLVPASALTLDDNGILGVRTVAADNTAQFMPVTMLRDTARGVLLTGLPNQVDIITVGQEFVTDGVPVRVTYEELTQ